MPDDLTLAWQRLRSSRETPTSGLHTTLNLAQSSRSPRRLRPTAPPEPAADLGDPRPRFPSSLAHLRVDLGPPRPTAQTVTSTSQNVEDQMLATIKERLAAVKAKEKSLEDQFDTLCTTHANLQRALQEAQDHEPQNDLKGGEEKVENEMLKKERQQADEEAASASAVQAEEESASASASQVENERLKRDLKKAQQQAEEEAASASASQVENETLKRDLKKAQQQAEEEAEKKKKKLEEQLEDGKRQAKDKEVENEMLKKGLQKAQQQVGAVNVTLYITLKDQPAEMADTAPKKSYPGEFRENAARCVISFPGKYPSGWDALVKGHHDSSIGCVFFTTPGERGFGDLVDPGEGGLGDHVQDPEAEEGICYCKAIYGERSWEKFHYLKKVKKENLKEELEKAKVTKIHVVEEDLYNSSPEKKEEADKEAQQKYEENKRRAPWGCAWFPAWMKNGHKAVEQGQKLQVVFFAGQKGKGKVHWNDLPGSELWNGEGLGGSQKGEVAYLDKMWRETNNPAWIYEEIDVMQFLQGEFNLEQEVDARDMAKNWRRGHIVGLPVAGAADDKEWVPKWTVQCNKDLEKFESTFLMHTVEPIDKLLKEVGKDNLSRMLEQHLPKGVDLDVMFASRCRLENGHAAFAVNVRVPHVKAIHMLRDQVLCGDLEAELNRSLADIHQSEFQVQVDKTEFFEQYESSLLSLSKLTHHQESKLRQLHQRKSKELHLTAPAGAGKTFVAVQFALDKVYENCKSEGAILYVAPRLSLCLHFVQWLIARHLWLKGRGGELEELLSRIVIMHKRDEDYVNVKLVLEGNQFAEHPAAAPEYLLAIFDEAHELFTTDEMTGIYRDLRANQKLLLSDMSQSASLRVALPEVEDTVSLSDVVRSTQRIVAAAQAFELEKSKGITTSCSGTNGPPLKTFIFEALDDAEMFHQCCRYTLDAIRHVFRSYPSLSSLHLRVAIIVPDKTFCDKFKGLLRDELTSTFTARKFQLRSFAESLRYLRSHHHDERAAGDEVLVLDTVEEARGQEMMVVICVGLDQKIADTDARKTDTLLTRARIYQGITRAQLMAIVVDKLIQGGFLQFLTTLKFNNKKFDQSFAFSEGTSKAASRIKKKAEALPSEVVEEKDGEGMDTAAMTGLSLAVVKDELGGIEQLLEVCIVKENDDGANKFISADGKAQGEIDKDGPRDDDRFETSIWDTDSNQTKSTSQTLAFDPRIDQVLGRILEELPGGESTPGLEARKEIDHTDGKSQAGLARYFEQKYKQGGDFEDEEYERDVKDWCWVHKPSGIKVWQDAIDLSQSGGSGHCVFHYTTGLGFRNITNTSSKVAEVFASLITAGEKANALWGAGVYTVRKTPDEWPSIESLLDNMYRNMLRRDIELKGHEHAGEVTQLYASRVAYCIPIIADAAILYDVSVHPTPEMVEQGRPAGVNLAGKLLNEPGKPVRSVIVVRVENEEENYVSNAYANLLPTLRTRARAVAARLGTKHAEAHSAFGRLATVLGARGAFREAERLWRQILEAKELELGAEHADTLACANNLAGVFRAQQKVDEAEPLYRRALSGFEAMAGTMHPYALACANNLAILLKDQGKLDEAEVLHRQTLELCESQLGEAHLDTLYALNNLAVLLGVNGKLKEAEALSRRALGFRQSLLGEMHPETLISWSSLATVLQAQGNLGEAEPSHRRALEGRESQLGLQHPHTLASMYGLAQLLEANGSIDEADQLYLRELTITEEIYGPDHIATRVSRKNLERFRGQHSTG